MSSVRYIKMALSQATQNTSQELYRQLQHVHVMADTKKGHAGQTYIFTVQQ